MNFSCSFLAAFSASPRQCFRDLIVILLEGELSQAPGWVMKIGLEWLYRLLQEPGRLWQRYLINNPSFLLFLP